MRVSAAHRMRPCAGPLRIALVAGEASGDLLGAGLIARAARALSRTREFAGIGGERMRAAGLDAWWPTRARSR